MKKILFYSIVFLLSFFVITSAKATGGTCSSHSGVNCSFGPDSDGSAICNDGWRDSSESYYDAQICFECKNPAYFHTGCKDKYDLGRVTVESGQRGGLMNSQFTGVIENCKNQIAAYDSLVSQYNDCLNKKNVQNDNYIYNKPVVNVQNELNKICQSLFGINAYYNVQTKHCACEDGYDFNNQIKCSSKNLLCQQYGAKEYKSDIKECVCGEGYVFVKDKCMTHTQDCQDVYGIYVSGVEDKDGNVNASDCFCIDGYVWSSDKKYCVLEQKPIINDSPSISTAVNNITQENINDVKVKNSLEEEKKLSQNEDKKLTEKLSGRILLQVEKNGEGWYLNPSDKKKYYLGRPADAFNAMRNLGLGIKHDELTKYLNSKFPNRLAGKIMLDVEQKGEAYYVNPTDFKGYFLNRPADAFKVMRDLGLGISNNDIRKINVGETE